MSYPPQSPPPQPHWDGHNWLTWNGHAWEVMPIQAPPPAAAAGSTGTGWFSAMSDPLKIALGVGAVFLLLLLGGGGYLLVSGDKSPRSQNSATPTVSSASPSPSSAVVKLVPVNSAENPFTPPVAQDAADVPPVEVQQPTEVSGDQVGLYGGSKKINVCDKAQLIAFLVAPENRAMGEGWAKTLGINYSDIRSYIGKTTSAILRSDTAVINHGWENGRVTGFTSVLQAGTAVLVNEYGVPVTRCYCGNPLTPPIYPPSCPPSCPPTYPPTHPPTYPPSCPPSCPPTYTPTYPPSCSPTYPSNNPSGDPLAYPSECPPSYPPIYDGPTWKWWKQTSVTVITRTTTIIKEYTFVNIYDPTETYLVPAGKNNTSIPKPTPTPEPEPQYTYEPEPQYTPRPKPSHTYSSPMPSHTYSSPMPSHTYSSPMPSHTYPSPTPTYTYSSPMPSHTY